MPIPAPKQDESEDSFMARCMGDEVMKREFPEQKQRVAVCMSKYRNKKKEEASDGRPAEHKN